MSNSKDYPNAQVSSETAPSLKAYNIPEHHGSGAKPRKPMDSKKIFQELEAINGPGGAQQLANLIAEGCFCTMLLRLREDKNDIDADYVDECYANWKWLTDNSRPTDL